MSALAELFQPEHTDPDMPPHPISCERCASVVPWEWLPLEHRGRVSRWIACVSKRGICRGCIRIEERAEAAADILRRQKRARIPEPFTGYRLSCLEWPLDDESPAEFHTRVRAMSVPTIGMDEENMSAIDRVALWQPRREPSIWLEGPVGSGKSLLAAAAATALLIGQKAENGDVGKPLSVVQAGKQGWSFEETRSARWKPDHHGMQTLFIEETELHARARLGWKGDPAPLYAVSEVPLLVLDDLGTCGRGSDIDKIRPVAAPVRDTIERLICYRADRKLPTLITSNEPIDHTETLYGKRVASRLADWMSSAPLRGEWRKTA